ncbi:F0F1 ATP synthase subunit gamma, partial [Candidatus Microgenomates bacterium]|nr:F0F1 ATP synthase subunit gamma [Candidatus Microgenomates bacterium]
ILNYEKVIVYHGEYQTILHQGITVSNITGQALFEQGNAPVREADYQFYFEPSLETILSFFETQIFANLFKQTLDESQLARNASRVKAMEQTMNNLADEDRRLKILQRKLNRKIDNKKQIDRYAGSRLWTGK